MTTKKSYKETLNLPQTDFPMRANLVQREPERLARWEKEGLYHQIVAARKAAGAPDFILHDGPPFANGDVHMGTALNKLLKDFIVKSRNMSGYHAPYVPGWDCHGLPIEFKVVKEARGLEPAEIRRRSEAFARQYIDVQRTSFKRLGVLGDWEDPYLTLAPGYEADIIRVFARLLDRGIVYQSKKPVSWSYGAQTALAEAEVEYKDKVSPSIYVKFDAVTAADSPFAGASFVIWTTTPWTLPANLAIAAHPEFEYLVDDFAHADGRRHRLVVGKPLLEAFTEATGFKALGAADARVVKGTEMPGNEARHPLLDRHSKLITADFVTAETGTGLVHIAPGHGQDDYAAGLQHGLEILSPVDDLGQFTDEVGLLELVGLHVFKANPLIVDLLRRNGALLGHHDFTHSYPHCWRSKTPIVFRAVPQYFIQIDALRQKALEEIDRVEWRPAWGRNRIRATVESRPDWCISRQRTWGVPLPVFIGPDGEAILDADLARQVADITEEKGTNFWFETSDEEWVTLLDLPSGSTRCRDTLDVWIDSGSSHYAVLDRHPDLHAPADIYIEATDQHRGWFQSSLMLSVAVRDAAPYKSVITHGFVVDNSTGEKISKSGEKPINASFFYDKYGADNLRLWAASVDYHDEVPFSVELFEQVVDAYRRLRNTIRVLLGNLHDFDRERDAVDAADLTLIDRWILERLHDVTATCRRAYDNYEFRRVYHELNQFCTVDLSSLFIDITKDRMYCDAPGSARRRASQTAMSLVTDTLCRLLAPILSFTADEAWEALGAGKSVHLERFPDSDPRFASGEATSAVEVWLETRHLIQKEIEAARQAKTVARSDEAVVELALPPDHPLQRQPPASSELAEFFIVSEVIVSKGGSPSVTVRKATSEKCSRCWRYDETVGQNAEHGDLCTRCHDALTAPGNA